MSFASCVSGSETFSLSTEEVDVRERGRSTGTLEVRGSVEGFISSSSSPRERAGMLESEGGRKGCTREKIKFPRTSIYVDIG